MSSDKFVAVRDGRGAKIRGLWKRGNRFYAQLTTTNGEGLKRVRRIPINAVTVVDAKEELNRKRLERAVNGHLFYQARTSPYKDVGDRFIKHIKALANISPKTIIGHEAAHKRLSETFGSVPLNQIRNSHVNEHIERRRAQLCPGGINVELSTLRSVFKYAVQVEIITELPPYLKIRNLKYEPAERKLITAEHIEKLCAAAITLSERKGQVMSELVRFLAYSGTRKDEARRVMWSDVDLERKILRVTSGDVNPEIRYVHMNPNLEGLLIEIHAYRGCLTDRPLFPNIDYPLFWSMVEYAGLQEMFLKVAFHSFRHFFISNCVMAGVDFRTIAEWVGHKDGGVLIGTLYSHLNHSHMESSAQKVVFK